MDEDRFLGAAGCLMDLLQELLMEGGVIVKVLEKFSRGGKTWGVGVKFDGG